jgi:hypothetical protein
MHTGAYEPPILELGCNIITFLFASLCTSRHWMLLNTHVRDEVHQLVGGDVPHTTATEADPEPVKQHRRDVAKTAMRSFGFTPRVHVWSSESAPVSEKPTTQVANPVDINVVANFMSGKTLSFRASNGITIKELKEMFQSLEGISPDLQRPIYNGKAMEDDMQLGHYTLDREDVMFHVAMRIVPRKPKTYVGNIVDFQLFVRMLDGRTKTFQISNGITILELKTMIQEREGIPPCHQRLIFAGFEVEDDVPVGCYTEDRTEHTFHLVLRLCGC